MFRLAPLFLFAASPALAHSGAHLHPHGAGSWLAVVLGLALIGAAGALMRRHALRERSDMSIFKSRDRAGR